MKREKGWFKIPGVQDGDRTLAQQLLGLEDMLSDVVGKTVLELGTAEGLILGECLRRGAASVHGVELSAAAVDAARSLCPAGVFTAMDLNDTEKITGLIQHAHFDVCLMLAILHKLRKPLELVEAVLAHRPALVVVRTAARTPGYVQDSRSGDVRYDFHPLLLHAGYRLRTTTGPFDEWMGYYSLWA